MKDLITLFCCLLVITTAIADLSPSVTSSWDVSQSTKMTECIEFFKGDTFARDYLFVSGTGPLDLSDTNIVIRWVVVPELAPGSTALSATGIVVTATNGHVRLSLTAAQTSISNQSYVGYVGAVISDGTNVISRKTLIRQSIQVLFSAGGF